MCQRAPVHESHTMPAVSAAIEYSWPVGNHTCRQRNVPQALSELLMDCRQWHTVRTTVGHGTESECNLHRVCGVMCCLHTVCSAVHAAYSTQPALLPGQMEMEQQQVGTMCEACS